MKTRKEIGIVTDEQNNNNDEKIAVDLVAKIAAAEAKYQEEVNHSFVGLNEGPFKALRRQLPVTRSKMNWGKAMGNYRLGKGMCIISISS